MVYLEGVERHKGKQVTVSSKVYVDDARLAHKRTLSTVYRLRGSQATKCTDKIFELTLQDQPHNGRVRSCRGRALSSRRLNESPCRTAAWPHSAREEVQETDIWIPVGINKCTSFDL